MAGNTSGYNNDVIVVKLEENHMDINDNQTNAKPQFENKIYQKDKEIAELKEDLLKMKHAKEIFEGKYEMEKLKSENILLKTEKQYGMDVKRLSDGKRQIEEELEFTRTKKAKLDEKQTKVKKENEFLKENSEKLEKKIKELEERNAFLEGANEGLKETNKKLQEKNNILRKEKTKFENSYKECRRENMNLRQQQKSAEKSSPPMNQKEIPRKNVVNDHFREQNIMNSNRLDYVRMPVEELLCTGVAMISEQTLNPNYVSWYMSMYRRAGKVILDIMWQDYLLIREYGGGLPEPMYIDLEYSLPDEWDTRNLSAKILHTSDNRKQRSIERLSADEWLLTDLPKDFIHDREFLILVKNNV